jgi:hypothetical protein
MPYRDREKKRQADKSWNNRNRQKRRQINNDSYYRCMTPYIKLIGGYDDEARLVVQTQGRAAQTQLRPD